MKAFNTLVDRVAADEDYLTATLSKTAQHDAFTGRLLQVLHDTAAARQMTRAAGVPEVVLGVHRSDYMLDAPTGGFLQVELNTIAASFACLSTITTQMHHYNIGRLAAAAARQQYRSNSRDSSSAAQQLLSTDRLPSNTAMPGICRALAAAVRAAGGDNAVMVMIVQPGERNAYDQQWLQHILWAEHGINTVRLTLAQIPEQLVLQPAAGQPDNKQLVFKGSGVPVGLVYYRAGYTPNDYSTEREWEARALIESSSACKCPSVAYQLAGSKKVQQDLASPGVIEKFMGQEQGPAVRQLFAGLWSLDNPTDPKTAAVIQDAIQYPDRYVLKPQREGGGNNLYGEDLVKALQDGLTAGGEGLAAYILMQRIVPPPQRTVFVRSGAWLEEESLSELGIYGTYLRVNDEVMINEEVGHLVRTKTSSSNEGGVAAGYAVLDSPLLAKPGEGLLPQQLDGGNDGATGWGAAGGVLAVAKAILGQ
eukprot:GHUV01023809.1.p1 GENE.GHUV01023809.1~~GHUV01023809.1.p1  ORF type:complete len:478 (+),score=162.56 GHUV01023809.1:1126-2559(+)